MPRKGYKSITVREDLYSKLMEKAQQESLTLSDLISKLFGEAFSQEKGSSGVQIPPSAPSRGDGKISLERIGFRLRYRNITVPEYRTIQEFERFCLIDRRLSTYSAVHYRSTVFRLLLHADKPLKQLTKDDVRSFLSLFSNNNTYRNNLKALRVFCRDFLKRPELVDTFRFPAPEHKPRFLPSKKELQEFFYALEEEHERVLFLLYATTGLRRSEILDLRMRQVDRTNRAVIPMHSSTQKKSWITFYNEEAEELFHPWLDRSTKEKVFPLSSERKFLLFKKAITKTGLDIMPQTLRFWFANEMARLGVPDRFIDAFQGRIPRSVLARHYTDYSLENLKQIYDRAGLKVLS